MGEVTEIMTEEDKIRVIHSVNYFPPPFSCPYRGIKIIVTHGLHLKRDDS